MRTAARVEEARRYVAGLHGGGRFRGTVLVGRSARTLLCEGFGSERDDGAANGPSTRYRIGSLSKQATAAAARLLARRGDFDLDAPMTRHLDLPDPFRAVTARRLLAHRGGVQDLESFPDHHATKHRPIDPAGLVRRIAARPLEFDPGSAFRYSSSGYVLVAAAIDRIAGGYRALVRRRLLEPAGLCRTDFERGGPDDPGRAAGHTIGPHGAVPAPPFHTSRAFGCGDLVSDVVDLDRWISAWARGDSGRGADRPAHAAGGYAWGWYVDSVFGRRRWHHYGRIDGFVSAVALFPQDEVRIVVLANLDVAPIVRMVRDLAAIWFDRPYELPRPWPSVRLAPQVLDGCTGRFEFDDGEIATVSRSRSQLYWETPELARMPLHPRSPRSFRNFLLEEELTFIRDARGRATALVQRQGIGLRRARRLDRHAPTS